MQKIAFASDHAAYAMKGVIKKYVEEKGYEVTDFGTYSEESCDYPDFAHPAACAVESGDCAFGIGMCGSGEGMAMTLNKHQGIRAGLCWIPQIAALIRQHNNANFLVLPGRFISDDEAKKIVDVYLESQFEGGRHQRRIDKMAVKGNCIK
ncbi:MAG: ribose 5-phosphate isomerase B [Prevotella sp.]|nr:ribose 5-phosphate isomerase B [Bacteroides sp.]MCM1366865.1 ribose 5-phosphate isomerase B [Prevotella sp.]